MNQANPNQTADEVEIKVKQLLSKQLGRTVSDLHNNQLLKADLGADSLDFVSLVLYLEEELGTEFADQDAAKIQTVQDVINIYRERMRPQ